MRNLLFTLVVWVVIGCGEDSEQITPTKTKLLTVKVDDSFATNLTDNWVVVNGEDGVVLASASFESDMVIELETNLSVVGKLTVTTISNLLISGNDFTVQSYVGVEPGKTIQFAKNFSSIVVTGNVNVSVSDVVDLDHYTLSSRLGRGGSYEWNRDAKIFGMITNTFDDAPKYLLCISDGSQLKHKIFDNVKADDSYSLSFNDMLPFDNTVTFNFPECSYVSLTITGSDANSSLSPNAYNILSHYNQDTHNNITAGYLNNFTNYKTLLNLTYLDYVVEYLNVGSVPNPEIAWPNKSDFHIATSSITDFSSGGKPYARRTGSWQSWSAAGRVIWSVSAPSDKQPIALPADLIAQYPALSLSKQVYGSAIMFTQSISYSDFIEDKFSGRPESPGINVSIWY